MDERNSMSYAFKSLLAGGLAGCIAKTFIGPFDRVKILFQASHPNIRHHQGQLTGVFRAVKEIYQNSGYYGLYRGHSAMLLRIFPYAAIQYMAFEEYKMNVVKLKAFGELNGFKRLIAGSLAGATAVFFTYPFDIIRARLAYQVHMHEHSSLSQILVKMFKERKYPWLAFYQGFGPSLLVRHSAKFLCGFVAGAAGQTTAYPFDIIRRRMQLVHIATHLPTYQHTFHALMEIVKKDGFKGLFVGLSINYLKVAPATGISFVSYEYLKSLFGIV